MSVKYCRRTNVSDEFKEAAQKEINEELESNSQILQLCSDDDDIRKQSPEIEKHLHKLKGLAPMVGHNSIGELVSLNDSLIKKILEGEKINGIFETITQSNQLMKEIMKDSNVSIDELKQTIKTKHSAFLD